MELHEYYSEINSRIEKIDFDALWKDFKPLKFALYNDKKCFFDGQYIEKTDDFFANTAIEFNGEVIAIWNVSEPTDSDVLTSKIVHEMFHGFQTISGEKRYADEMDALFEYCYSNENLSVKDPCLSRVFPKCTLLFCTYSIFLFYLQKSFCRRAV